MFIGVRRKKGGGVITDFRRDRQPLIGDICRCFFRICLIKIFCEAEINQVFVIALVAQVGVGLLVLVEQAREEGVGEIVGNLGTSGQRGGFRAGGILKRVGTGQDDVRARPGGDRKTQARAVFHAAKTVAVQVADVVAQNVGVGDDFRAENLVDVVAEDFVDFVVKAADGAAVKKRLLGIGAGLVPEADAPEQGVPMVAKIVADFGMKLQLVGDRAVEAGAHRLLETVLQIRLQRLVDDEGFEAQVFPLGDEADGDLIAQFGQAAAALVVPQVFVRGLHAQPRLGDDQPVRLGADDVAVINNVEVAVLIAAAAGAAHGALGAAEDVTPGLVEAVEPAAAEVHRVVAHIAGEARDADAEIVGENHIPAADDGVPCDFGADDGFVVETQQIRAVEPEARDAGLVLQRQIDKRAGDRDAQPLGELRDDRAADGQDADGAGLAVFFREVDVVAPQDGGGEPLQFEKDGAEFEVGILRFKAALEQRQCGAEGREPDGGAGFDGLGLHRGRDGWALQRIGVGRSGVAENFRVRHAGHWRCLVSAIRKRAGEALRRRGGRVAAAAKLRRLGWRSRPRQRDGGQACDHKTKARAPASPAGRFHTAKWTDQDFCPPVKRLWAAACLGPRSRWERRKKSCASCSRRKEDGR